LDIRCPVTPTTPPPTAAWSRWLGPGLGLGSLALYAAGLCRDLYWYDSAEYTAAAVTLGIPHPPGYPLYTLLAHLFTWLPLPAPLAVNFLSAVGAALAVTLAYGCARRLGAGAPGAAAGALLLAGAPALWTNAVVAEVYAPALCFALGALTLLLDARTRATPWRVAAAALLAGLGLGVHLSLATLGLGYVMLSALALPGTASRGARLRWLGSAALCVLAGYALAYAYVPLRAGAGGVPDHAVPTSLARYLWLLSGGNYSQWFVVEGSAWTLGKRLLSVLLTQLTPFGLALASLGLGALLTERRAHAAALLAAITGNLVFFARYRVDDLEVFVLPAVAVLALLAGLGVDALAKLLASLTDRRALLGRALPALALLLAVTRIAYDFPAHDLSQFHDATRYAERLERELPARAVILDYTTPAEWKYASVFAMYHQGVLGKRHDVVVARNLGRSHIARLLAEGRPVYMFARVEALASQLLVQPEGAALRVVALLADPS
jgi:hypothetical protein